MIPQYSHSAKLESGNIFRDYAVHDFLETQKQLHRLSQEEIDEGLYYSREFFKDAKPSDIDEAIEDISNSEKNNDGKYHFYSPDSRFKSTIKEMRTILRGRIKTRRLRNSF